MGITDVQKEREMEEEGEGEPVEVNLEVKNYFAVFYEIQWYLGCIVVKFLKENSEQFIWPPDDDTQEYYHEYISCGPLTLIGHRPTCKKITKVKIWDDV